MNRANCGSFEVDFNSRFSLSITIWPRRRNRGGAKQPRNIWETSRDRPGSAIFRRFFSKSCDFWSDYALFLAVRLSTYLVRELEMDKIVYIFPYHRFFKCSLVQQLDFHERHKRLQIHCVNASYVCSVIRKWHLFECQQQLLAFTISSGFEFGLTASNNCGK